MPIRCPGNQLGRALVAGWALSLTACSAKPVHAPPPVHRAGHAGEAGRGGGTAGSAAGSGASGAASPRDAGLDAAASVDAAPWMCEPGRTAQPGLAPLPHLPPMTLAHEDDDAGTPLTAAAALRSGPIVGAVSSHTAAVWVQTQSASDWAVRIWQPELPDQVRRIVGGPLSADTDYVGALEFSGLRASTEYAYQVELSRPGAQPRPHADEDGRFRTFAPNGQAGRTRFVVGADISNDNKQPIFDQIGATHPDFVLLLGDQVYADASAFEVNGYIESYVHGLHIRNFATLLRNTPTFMIWDDHEIEDDFSGVQTDRYGQARLAYELFVNAHNPAPRRRDELYYQFEAGDVSVFVLDTRSHRSPKTDTDSPDKTMLGAQQKADLFDWLRCAPGRVKVIASSVTFSNWGTTGADSWAGYSKEREEIFAFIAAQRVDDVLLVSGDQHWSAVFVQDRPHYRFYEFMATPLSKGRRPARNDDSREILARDDDHFVFGVIDIDTREPDAKIDLTLCAADAPCTPGAEPTPTTGRDLDPPRDNVPFSIHLRSSELGLR